MKITLTNGTELSPLTIYGVKREVQGANRDTLHFVFAVDDLEFEYLDSVFTAENCETITIIEESGDSYIHKAYTIRAELTKKNMQIAPATEETEAVYADRYVVAMAQRTDAENQLKEMESAMMALAGVGV